VLQMRTRSGTRTKYWRCAGLERLRRRGRDRGRRERTRV